MAWPREAAMLLLFSTTLFLSATLLFAFEPMFGRMVLPRLGGSPSVWNTVMVFYQAALLVGYGYAHALGRRGDAWRPLHLAAMAGAAFLLPVGLGPDQVPDPSTSPVPWLLATMTVTIGPPFVLVATTGPLVQRWFAESRHRRAHDPYFLYVVSNLGSLIGLLAYPFLIEPRWSLDQQSRLWAWGYAALVGLVAACALAARGGSPSIGGTVDPPGRAEPDDRVETPPDADRMTWLRRSRWVALAFAPSCLMLGVTTHLSTDLVAIPLLWVIPLAVYLVTFMIAFARHPLIPLSATSPILTLAALGVLLALGSHASEPLWFVITLHLGALSAAGLSCHVLLAVDRPGSRHLTEFYLWLAAGGAAGGAFNALAAPMIFRSASEYPIALIVSCLLAAPWPERLGRRERPGTERGPTADTRRPTPAGHAETAASPGAKPARGLMGDLVAATAASAALAAVIVGWQLSGHQWTRAGYVFALAMMCFPLFSFRRRPVRFGLGLAWVLLLSPLALGTERNSLYTERSFFGIHRVRAVRDSLGTMHKLIHGTTVHGSQWIEPRRCDEPLGYYHRLGPAGQIFASFGQLPRASAVAVAGLGTGALSAYSQVGQRWSYFEIDPAVARIAANPRWFCYLSAAAAPPRIVLGDARLTLAADTSRYDLMVLDAYSSDAIPVHLLTREAFREYVGHLRDHGVLAVHLSNRFFDLEPVLARLAADAGLMLRTRADGFISRGEAAHGRVASHWAVMARSEADLAPLPDDPRWRRGNLPESTPLWTDGYSSLVRVLR
jgi:hypothetical protein